MVVFVFNTTTTTNSIFFLFGKQSQNTGRKMDVSIWEAAKNRDFVRVKEFVDDDPDTINETGEDHVRYICIYIYSYISDSI